MIGIIAVCGLPLIALHGLQAVHARHEMIHEDRMRGDCSSDIRLPARRIRHVDFDVVFLEHAVKMTQADFESSDD